jgi:hypothetical protein
LKKFNVMAKVISPFTIRGSIGDLNFRDTSVGNVAGLKPGPTREQVLTSDDFERTRRNAGEFKSAIKNAKLLRQALGDAIAGVRHQLLSGHMNRLLLDVAKQDTTNRLGFRHAGAGDFSKLEGFDFNYKLPLDRAFPVKFQHRLDALSGNLQLELPSFIARRKKGFPKGATHFRIISCGALVDFMHDNYSRQISMSDLLPLSKKTPGPIGLNHQLKAAPNNVLIQVLGIQFCQVVSGQELLLKGGAMRILASAHINNKLREPVNATLPDTQTSAKRDVPYRAKDLHAIMGTQQGKNEETLGCCYLCLHLSTQPSAL